MDKEKLIDKIKNLQGLTNDEKADLLGLLRSFKKYGLVWEEKLEEVEERLREEIPVLTEVKERAIISESADAPNHILIEGDNLEALTTLSYTHEGKIDFIYIDPPYNTLKNEKDDFTYNDKRIDSNDPYPHSKWLSFMSRRLKIAQRLLSHKGCIFISISDHEFANLKLLCDEIFNEQNFLGCIIWNSTKSVTNTAVISVSHTYNLVYFKNKDYIVENRTKFRIPEVGDGFDNPDGDPRGPWKADPFQVGGWRPNQQYVITNPNTGVEYRPNPNCSWKNDYNKFKQLVADDRIVFGKNGTGAPQRKRFLWEAEERGRVTKTIWDDVETTTNGTQLLKSMFNGEIPFSNSKPISLIKRMIQLGADRDSIVLDFFAGSGTTMHATIHQNAEDGGKRKCILVTNNENGICENVTYLRNKKVIEGYTTSNGEEVAGLSNNTLRYYRTEFLPRERSPRNMRALVSLATDLLCIKEDLYTEQQMFGKYPTHPKLMRYFADDNKQMLILYKEEAVSYIVEEIKNMEFNGKLKIYIFTPGRYPFSDDFFEVQDKVELVALPAAIYDAYTRVLPKRKEKYLTPEKEGEATPQTLFNDNEEGEE